MSKQKLSDNLLDNVAGGAGLPQDVATSFSSIMASDDLPPMPQDLASHIQDLKNDTVKEPDTDLIMKHADFFRSI